MAMYKAPSEVVQNYVYKPSNLMEEASSQQLQNPNEKSQASRQVTFGNQSDTQRVESHNNHESGQ